MGKPENKLYVNYCFERLQFFCKLVEKNVSKQTGLMLITSQRLNTTRKSKTSDQINSGNDKAELYVIGLVSKLSNS